MEEKEKENPKSEEIIMDKLDLNICPNCKRGLDSRAYRLNIFRFCPYCGREVKKGDN
ncbi:MAG: hypothetical protein KKD18_05485 [Nanoarchaeota archaeon]|nr:hypothetical protein [Nanoarchaeota archaeon]